MIFYLGIDGGGTKTELALADQQGNIIKNLFAEGCNPMDVGIEKTKQILKAAIYEICGDIPLARVKVFAGIESVNELVKSDNIDIVLAAMVGFSGLEPTINAVKNGKIIALANKETLVAGGAIITELAKKHGSPILPVDSEHSAIFQCLQGERAKIEKLVLTASGGPFLNTSISDIQKATSREALKHPNWSMGAKVTIDSASMMNKGFMALQHATRAD